MRSPLPRGWCAATVFFAAIALSSAAEAQVVSSFQPGQGVFNESNKPLATVDPVMGVAHATVPFLLNSARGAAQPELTLVYSSDAGDETAGRGWGLSLPSIERRPLSAPGLGIARDNRFVFSGQPIVPVCEVLASKCSNPALGNESLPPWTVDGSPGAPWTYYRAQVEGAFMRLFLSSDLNTWRVEMKNGVTMEFGAPLTAPRAGATSIDGQLQANASPLAAAADGRFRWNLVRQFDSQVDTQGNPVNVIVYQWALFPRDDRQLGGVPGFGAALLPTAGVPANGDLGLNYLMDVFDTPRPGVGLDNVGVYAHHAHLSYASNPVPDVSHALVWRATPSKPLSGIDITSANFAGTGPRELARRYHLTYQTMLHSSFLTSVQLEGRCPGEVITEPLPAATNCPPMPAMTFQYSQNTGANPPWPHPIAVQSLVPGEQVFSNIFNLGVMDINGDGLPDIVEILARRRSGDLGQQPAWGLREQRERHAGGLPEYTPVGIANIARCGDLRIRRRARIRGSGQPRNWLRRAEHVPLRLGWRFHSWILGKYRPLRSPVQLESIPEQQGIRTFLSVFRHSDVST